MKFFNKSLSANSEMSKDQKPPLILVVFRHATKDIEIIILQKPNVFTCLPLKLSLYFDVAALTKQLFYPSFNLLRAE